MPSRHRRSHPVAFACAAGLVVAAFTITGIGTSSALAAAPPFVEGAQAGASVAVAVLHDVNTLRKSFGLPGAQLTTSYTAEVTAAAAQDADPELTALGPRAVEGYGLWGIASTDVHATSDPATIVSDWVYDDGWDGAKTVNLDCTAPSAPGCEGHRRAILSKAPQPGDRLAVDIAAEETTFDGAPALSVAMLMVWRQPTQQEAPAPASSAADAVRDGGTTPRSTPTVAPRCLPISERASSG